MLEKEKIEQDKSSFQKGNRARASARKKKRSRLI